MYTNYLKAEPARREAIITAALKEFASKGYDDASTNVMAREAGISKPLFFHYVNSKKELFLFLCDYSVKALKIHAQELMDSIKKDLDLLNRLRKIIKLKINLLHKLPQIYHFYTVAFLTESKYIKEELAKLDDFQLNSLKEIFFENIDTSRFKEGIDVEKALKLLFWASEGFAHEVHKELNTTRQFDYERYLADFEGYIKVLEKSFYK